MATNPAEERLTALQTERAYLLENGKRERASQVDDEIEALLARSVAARDDSALETTQAQAPPETADEPRPRRGRPPGSKNKPKDEPAED